MSDERHVKALERLAMQRPWVGSGRRKEAARSRLSSPPYGGGSRRCEETNVRVDGSYVALEQC